MFNNLYEKIKDFIKRYKDYICLLIFIMLCFYPLNYVIYCPGGYISVSDRIDVDTSNNMGDINMAYVTVREAKLPTAIMALFLKNWDLYPNEVATFSGSTYSETVEIEKLEMKNAISSAIMYAYQKAGKQININKQNIYVVALLDEAQTDIKLLDRIISVDGVEVNNVDDLHNIMNQHSAGDEITILVERNKKEIETHSKLFNYGDSLVVGASLLFTYDYDVDPKIDLSTNAGEMGSSGGLMMSLAIYNSLVEEDITHGKKIVGTGTIDINGNVGDIGGVKYKLLGAKKKKADVFICPIGNYDEALKYKEEFNLNIEIVGVKTFDEALNYFMNN